MEKKIMLSPEESCYGLPGKIIKIYNLIYSGI